MNKNSWLIKDLFPLGHRIADLAGEGGGKTILGCGISTHIAAGRDILEYPVKQGRVLIVDEETPRASLENHLNRFSQGLGFRSYRDLPNKIFIWQTGKFRFGRKTQLDKLLPLIEKVKPVFIRFDSLISMLPSGRQGINENDCNIGLIIRDDFTRILKHNPQCTILAAVHCKKFFADLTLREVYSRDLQILVRGHGSIVGEGADTGIVIKKLSEYPEPTRFAYIVKVRRQGIPASREIIYAELKEKEYSVGPMWLERIPAAEVSPSKQAKALFQIFQDKEPHSGAEIRRVFTLWDKKAINDGLADLIEHKVIVNGCKPQVYRLNPSRKKVCNKHYFEKLT